MINNVNTSHIAYQPNINRGTASKAQNSTSFAIQRDNNAIVNLDSSALVSSALRIPGGGMMSASVFKSDSFSADNPVMLVRGTDGDGKPFEIEVNINNVNPQNASFIDMFALDGYFAANGQPSGTTRAAAGAMSNVSGRNNAFTQFDFISPLKELLDTQLFHKNWDGVMRLKPVVDNILEFMNKKENDSKAKCDSRELPGAEALTLVSDLPRYIRENAVDIYKYRDNYNELPEQNYTSTGIRYLGAVRFEHEFASVTETDMIGVLSNLRDRFGIPINVVPSNGEFLQGDIWKQENGNSKHIITISADGLMQMASNPNMYARITENIQKWIDASSDLVRNSGPAVAFSNMYIGVNHIDIGYATMQANDRELSVADRAWQEFMRTFQEWTENRSDIFRPEERARFGFRVLLE